MCDPSLLWGQVRAAERGAAEASGRASALHETALALSQRVRELEEELEGLQDFSARVVRDGCLLTLDLARMGSAAEGLSSMPRVKMSRQLGERLEGDSLAEARRGIPKAVARAHAEVRHAISSVKAELAEARASLADTERREGEQSALASRLSGDAGRLRSQALAAQW